MAVACAFLLGAGTSRAQSADPALSTAAFFPIRTLVGTTSELRFTFSNTGSTAIPVNSVELAVCPAFNYYTAAGAPYGPFASAFTWTPPGPGDDDCWRGVNNVSIPRSGGGQISLTYNANVVTAGPEITNINVQIINNFLAFQNTTGNDNLQPDLEITEPPELRVVKTASVATAPSATNFTYTIRINNDGAGLSLLNTVVSDALPTGITLNSFTAGAGWTCSPAAPLVGPATLNCNRAAGVNAGVANQLVATLNVTKTVTGDVTNTATVTSGDPGCVAPLPARCASSVVVAEPSNADMSVAVTGLPSTAGPGAAVNGNVVCTNIAATTAATNPTCAFAAGTPAGATVTANGVCTYSAGGSATSVPAGGTITCPITVTMPGTAGGTDTTQTSVGVNGTTSATNDGNTANNSASATVAVIDALNDSVTTPFGTAGTVNVLTNDTNGANPAVLGATPNVTLTQTVAPTAGSTFDPTTGVFSVPNNAPAGTYTVSYQICAFPATTPAACDNATATLVVGAAADMSVAVTGLPSTAGPGAAVNGNVVCTNIAATTAATNPTCAFAAGTPAGATVTANGVCTYSAGGSATSVPAGGTITCPITVTMPGTAGGTDTTQTSVGVNGTTSATNDGNTANNSASATVAVIDALNDSVTTPFGTAGTVNVLTNDTNGANPAVLGATPNVTLTQTVAPTAGSTFDPTTGVFSVPNNAPAGTYTVSYQICAFPATTPAACDNATATLVVGAAADMSVAVTGLPSTAGPGAAVNGNVVCTNIAATTAATNPTCAFAAGTPAGATVTANGVCTYSAGGSATSVPAGGTITCPITVTMPGTAGGTDTTQTSVGVNGTTSATNDGNTANNSASATVAVIDALNDSVTTPFGTAGTVNVLTNDTNGANPAVLGATPNVTLTQTVAPTAGSTFDPTTGVFSVPNNAPAGTYTVSYQICAFPATTPAACDNATATLVVGAAADMSVAVTGLPSTAGPGAAVNGNVVCTNIAATTAATNPTCAFAAGTPAGATVTANGVCTYSAGGSATSVPAGGTITCPITVTMPGTAGGTDTTQTSVGVNGTTSATNDGNTANNSASATVAVIDALNDSVTTPFGTAGTVNVLTNDTNGANPAVLGATPNVTLTQTVAPTAGSTFDPTTGVFSVPNNAPAGTYTVSYQICAFPATTPAACDNATATLVVGAAADMSVAVTGLPSTAGPGAAVNGNVVCTNIAATTAATNPTCAFAAGTPAGATVTANGVCTYSAGGSATSVPAGGTITCPITVTMPGTAGGTDTTQTSVGVNGTTSATNDGNTANNSASATVAVIDALNDSVTTPFGTAGTVNVLTNDTNGANPAVLGATPNVTLTQTVAPTAGSTFDPTTGVFSVPNNAPAGTYTVSYQICAFPATTPAACDNATATLVVGAAADMSVAVTGLPSTAGPGAAVNGNVVCTNIAATTAATNPTCAFAAGTPAGATVTANGVCTYSAGGSATSVPAGGTITCPITVTMPGTAGGTDTTQTSVGVNGTTSATNDGNTANNSASATVAVIDALNDSVTTPFGTAGTVNVLTNDTNGANPAVLGATPNVTLTQTVAPTAGSTFDPTTGVFSVPNNAPAGTYTVSYQICAFPATTPAACDNATATLVVGAAADMSVAVTGLPSTAGPGAAVNGNVVCTNIAATTAATNPTCAFAAGTPAGATVTANGVCTYSAGGSATSVPAGGTITCPITVTMPGTAGGTDTTQTSVGVNGTTSATNDGNTANNSASATVAVIDALNDSVTTPFGTAGTVNVLTNDTNGANPAVLGATPNVTLTQTVAPTAGSTFDPTTGVFSVPNNAPAGTYTVSYQICAFPATTPAACDNATATLVVGAAADMSVAVTGLPSTAGPGAAVNGNVVCTNIAATTAATNPTCAFAAGTPAGATVTANGVCTYSAGGSATSVPAGGTITCPITVTMPGTAGGTDTTQTSVGVNGTTSATNDGNTANNSASATVAVIDALNDSVTTPFGTAGTVNVLTNDTNGANPAVLGATPNVTLTQTVAPTAGSTFDPTTGVFSVPNNAPAGTYTVSYQICAFPATTPAACDNATATLVVGAAADMSVAVTGLPSTAGPGAAVNGNVVCTNIAATTAATNPTCAFAAGTPAGATVTANGVCTYSAGGSATSVPAGGTITCPITVTMPGTAGGTDTTQTSVGVNGTTSATNDGNTANNSASATVAVIDALNDNLGPIGSTAGGTTSSVLGNDQVNSITADGTPTTGNVVLATNGAQTFIGTGTPSTLVLNTSTGVITVPATATPGTYTVPYQICASPATTPAACDSGVATVIVTGAPALSVTKLAGVPTVAAGTDPNKTDAGDSIAYSFSVTNTGNVDLANVTITDTKLPTLTCAPIATLVVGATQSISCSSGNIYTLTASDIATGSTTNVATATGTAPSNTCATAPCNVTGTSTSTVPTETNGGISVTKLASPGVFTAAGDVISYTILVENTGTSALTSVNVTDPKAGTVTCASGNPIAILAVGASTACTASYTITAGDVAAGNMANVARATGTAPPNSCATPPCTVTGTGTTTVVTASTGPQLKVVKQASPKTVSAVGQVIDYTIVGTNTGDVTLTKVSISDSKVPGLTCAPTAPATLGVGATITCTGAYTLTAADAASGSVTNIATGTGTPPSGPPVTGTGTSTTPVVPVANDDFDGTTLNTPVTTPLSGNDQYPTGSTVLTNGTSSNGGTVTCTSATATPASCTYTPPTGFVGTDTYTYKLCLPSPNQAVCDTAIVSVTVSAADMSVAIGGLPATAGPSAVLNGTVTCTNTSTVTAATQATCAAQASAALPGATVSVGQCQINGANVTLPTTVGTAAPNNAIICPLTVTMPVNPANSNVGPAQVAVDASTSAANDNNTANNTVSFTVNVVDAVNDSVSTPFGTAGSLNVLGNDAVGNNPAVVGATPNVVVTVVTPATAGSTFDPVTGNFTVPANAAPGTYTVTYQICSTITPAACDTAVATITVDSARTISGNVFNDLNGSTDGLVNGTGTDTGTAGALTAYLVDPITGNVVASATVSPTGAYLFPLVADGTYNIVLSTTAGATSNPTPSLPPGWVNTGEGTTSAGTAPTDGIITSVVVAGAAISGANFGIEQPPLGQSNTDINRPNPGGTTSVPVTGTTFTTGATDPSGGTVTGYLVGFPTGADSITIAATTYTSATFATAFPSGSAFVPVAIIGTVLVDPAGSGTGPGSVAIPFRPVDNAGLPSSTVYTATVPFGAGSTVSGNVFDDDNGLTDVTINGTGTNAGGLTAYLVDGATGTVVSASAVAANGSYSFANVANGAYTVVISATAGQTSNPTTNLPSNWVTTGEGANAAGDGVPDGRTAVTVNGASIGGVNFGIEQRPIAGGTTLPSQTNPGGTTSVPVAATAFQTGSSDADGVITSYTITTFPTNATSITIGGIVYTATGGNGTTAFPATGVVVPAANIGGISVDPIDGAVTVAIAFTATDNAGVTSSTPGTANIPFAAATADLAVQKNGPAAVQAGSVIVYSITLINNGLGAADGATFNDTLPAGLTGVTAACTGSAGTGTSACAAITLAVTGSSVSGSIPSFPSGGSVFITIRGTAPATGPVTNTVTITPPPGVTDPTPGNNTSSVTTSIGTPPLSADISVIKTGPAATTALSTISYVVDVVNGGPGLANGSTFTDVVPASITGVTWTCTASGQAVCPAASGSGNNITQTIAVMPMNGRLRYVVSGTVAAGTTASIVNTATVTPPSGVTDPNPNNNTSTVTTAISTQTLPQANLSMSKVGPSTVLPGGIVRYTLVATNNGPSAADGAVVSDTFPNVLISPTWTCVASVGATCGSASGSGNLALSLPTFAAGSQVTITVTGTAPNSGTFQNSARVITPPTVFDPDPTDNIGGPVITTVLLAPADLVTTVVIGASACPGNAVAAVAPAVSVNGKRAQKALATSVDRQKCPGDPVTPGQPVLATVTMGNIGPSPAGNVTVTLQIPPGSTAVTPSNGGVYDPATSTISWPMIVFVPASTNPLVTYTATFIPPATGGTVVSNVRTPDAEVTLTNNPANATLLITAIPAATPEPIPTTPWWVLAFGLLFFARRSLVKVAGGRQS